MLTRVINHMGNNFNRDYLLEKFEHLESNIAASAVYNHLSLAPGQRFASKGGYKGGYIAKTIDRNTIRLPENMLIP